MPTLFEGFGAVLIFFFFFFSTTPLVAGQHSRVSTPRSKKLRYFIRLSYFGFRCACGIHTSFEIGPTVSPEGSCELIKRFQVSQQR